MNDINIPKLETDRLILRPININDLADMYEYASDDEVTKYLTWPTHKSIETTKRVLKNIISQPLNNHPETLAIILKDDNKMIGTIDYPVFNNKRKFAEIGFILNRDYWGKGIMFEAGIEVIKLGFDYFNLNRLEITHMIDNNQSKRVIEKLGFTFEGIKRKSLERYDGSIHDVKLYSIIKDEYTKGELLWQKQQ